MNKPNRLLSLDALRGFDMFWITGGEEFFHTLAKATAWGWAVSVSHQLTHPAWHGFAMYDLIFPMFLFMAGVSTPFSLGGKLSQDVDKKPLIRKIIQRGLLLVLLGVIYNNGLQIKPLHEIRFASVLGRIGLAGMFAQLIYLYTSPRARYYWFAGLLLGYWFMLALWSDPACTGEILSMECNCVSYFDRMLLPGRLHKIIHDPEGILSTIPAVGTALLGIFAGELLRKPTELLSNNKKVIYLAGVGTGFVMLSLVWNVVLPINKNLWTSSFVLLTGGLSLLFLALFYWLIDVRGWQRWAFGFVLIGSNSILIYLAQRFIDFGHTAQELFGGVIGFFPNIWYEPLGVVAYITVELLLLYFLYKKKVFLKV